MIYDFDRRIERRGTASLKYDFAAQRRKPADALPLWVADMDFPAPPCVLEALAARVQHGIFGYTEITPAYFEAVANWYDARFHWQVKREWLVKTPSVVFAVCAAIRAFTKEGDGVLIQTPVYYPFTESVRVNNRKLVENRLVLEKDRYVIDFDDFEAKIRNNGVKLFLLCSPHNPVSRVWTREELTRLGEICLRHDVLVVADEIHQDFIYPGHKHTVFADLSPELAASTITCTAPSKTFNLAGLQISNIFICNAALRRRFAQEVNRAGFSQANAMGITACEAGYRHGGPWVEALLHYLRDNMDYLDGFLKERAPGIKLIPPEGTYLAWLDCRELNLSDADLDDFMLRRAKLWLDAGTMFGPGGEGFQRINVACPRSTLAQALGQLEKALS